MAIPEVIVVSDYDGYFESVAKQIVALAANLGREQSRPFVCTRLEVTAGPWRTYALSVDRIDPETIRVDFYSALRTGFGSLTRRDLIGAAELLLAK